MKGAFYFKPKGRDRYRIGGIKWQGKKMSPINIGKDGGPLFHPKQCEATLECIADQINRKVFNPDLWKRKHKADIWVQWEKYDEQTACGELHKQNRNQIFRDYIAPYFENIPTGDIQEGLLKDWCFEIRNKEFSPSYLREIVKTFRAFLRDRLPICPKFPKIVVPEKRVNWLTEKQQDEVLEFMQLEHLPVFKFMRMTACRPSEACHLKKTDVDWEKERFIIADRKNKSVGIYPIITEMAECFKSPKIVDNLTYIFCDAKGKPYTHDMIYHWWRMASQKAHTKYGTPVYTPTEGMRKSKACQLLNDGIPLSDIARLLGHRTVRTTEKHYAKMNVERLRGVLKR